MRALLVPEIVLQSLVFPEILLCGIVKDGVSVGREGLYTPLKLLV